jgi:quinoprotein glucose dehydrogenase
MTARVIETDVCIVGSGITAAMVAEKLADERNVRVLVVEAGDDMPPVQDWYRLRRRFLDYGESPWPSDHLDDAAVEGIQSRSMCVGGLAMHWGGVTPRFSPEDFQLKSTCGVGDDWPITYDDLDPFYQEAEERMGVSGEQGPADIDPRNKPFPLPKLPLSYNLEKLHGWVSAAGIPMWSQPSAKNSVPYKGRSACCRNDTCTPICPVGAKYSPDATWRALRTGRQVTMLTRTLVRRLIPAPDGDRIEVAQAYSRDRPTDEITIRARTFVVAGGYVWSAHLLLLSTSSRYPNGLANRSGLVGKYLTGHRNVSGFVSLPIKLYPGLNEQHSLVSKHFMRRPRYDRYLRHDLRVWESAADKGPRLRNDAGELMLGDAIMNDWRQRTETGTARVRCYYDVIPARESELTLDSTRRNAHGDPLPRLSWRDADVSRDLRVWTEEQIRALFETLARAGNGRMIRTASDSFQDHPAGGCRMGRDASTGVVNSWGRTFQHENLFVVGAPTMVSGSCANATLTFCALSLRSAAEIGKEFSERRTGDVRREM